MRDLTRHRLEVVLTRMLNTDGQIFPCRRSWLRMRCGLAWGSQAWAQVSKQSLCGLAWAFCYRRWCALCDKLSAVWSSARS